MRYRAADDTRVKLKTTKIMKVGNYADGNNQKCGFTAVIETPSST